MPRKARRMCSIRGGYRTHPLEAGKAMDARPNLIYPIPAPDGTQIMPRKQWLWSKERTYEALKNNELEIVKGKDGAWVVSSKQYLRNEDGTMRPGKMFSIIDDIYTQHGTNEMISIFGNAKVFSYPKPSELIRKLVNICGTDDYTVLDFFSGSASTAHAVMKQNAKDFKKRKYIMVQLPEKCDEHSDAYKAGYGNICEIGKERIRRTGECIREGSPLTTQELDVGFRVFKIDESNMKDVYFPAREYEQQNLSQYESNIKEDRTDLDLLFGCLLEWGLPLSLPYIFEEIDGYSVHTYGVTSEENSEIVKKISDEGSSIDKIPLIACFDENIPDSIIKTIAKRQPLRAVFRDSSFMGSPEKINVGEIFKMLAPDTRVKVI